MTEKPEEAFVPEETAAHGEEDLRPEAPRPPRDGFSAVSPERHRLRFAAAHVGLAMIFFVLFSIFLTLPVVLLFSRMGLPVSLDLQTLKVYGAQWALRLVSLTVTVVRLGVPFLFLLTSCRQEIRLSSRLRLPRLRPFAASFPLILGVSVVGAFAAEYVQNLAAAAGFFIPVPSFSIPEDPSAFVFSLVLYTVVPAVLEEFLFRGAILQGLRCFGDGIALVASSLFFALAHFNLPQSANAFLVGLALGYFVLRTGSLWTGVALHFAVNLFAFLEAYLFKTVLSGWSELTGNLVSAVFLAVGAVVFFFWSRREPAAFALPVLRGSGVPVSRRAGLLFGNVAVLLSLLLLVIGFGV